MELKLVCRFVTPECCSLLIVPYGIETPEYRVGESQLSLLLIVPYGIGTDYKQGFLLFMLDF